MKTKEVAIKIGATQQSGTKEVLAMTGMPNGSDISGSPPEAEE